MAKTDEWDWHCTECRIDTDQALMLSDKAVQNERRQVNIDQIVDESL